MDFDPANYGPEVARILALDGNGNRLLARCGCGPCSSEEARGVAQNVQARTICFAAAKSRKRPMAGLWLYFSCFEEAHDLADNCKNAEGDLWHAILHRQEGDSGNAAYWFRKAGSTRYSEELAPAAARSWSVIRTPSFVWAAGILSPSCPSASGRGCSPADAGAGRNGNPAGGVAAPVRL